MRLENKTSKLAVITTALRVISKETSYRGVADPLLKAVLAYSRAVQSAVLLRGCGQFVRVESSFPRKRAKVIASHPQTSKFELPANSMKVCLAQGKPSSGMIAGKGLHSLMPQSAWAPGDDLLLSTSERPRGQSAFSTAIRAPPERVHTKVCVGDVYARLTGYCFI